MADINFGDGLRKVFLAGIGALATTVEKSQEIVDDLVKKGELTVDQGKQLNSELTIKAKETVSGAQDAVLRARMSAMTAEERAAFVDRARALASDLDAAEASAADKPEVEDPDDTQE